MANSIELTAARRAIANSGQFFCSSCQHYKPLEQSHKHGKTHYRCTACIEKVKARMRAKIKGQ
jgi:hypothetical protein